MALLNQGFVRSLNLFEIEDATLALQNLSDSATIPADLRVFAGNVTNFTRLFFTATEPTDIITNPPNPDSGTIFEQTDKLATLGNGDRVKLRVAQKINNIQRTNLNAQEDSLTVTYQVGHGIPQATFNATTVFISLEGTSFEIAGTALNKIFYRAEYISTTQVKLRDVGYQEKIEFIDGLPVDVNDPGAFLQPSEPTAPPDYFPYSACRFFTFPDVAPGFGDPIGFEDTYFVVLSDAVTTFRLGRNFSRTQLIEQIRFDDLTQFNGKTIIFERSNECTQENLINLARPVFEDDFFNYSSGSLGRTFDQNFTTLEGYLDSANFFRQKKFLSIEDNFFNVDEISSEGEFGTSDPDAFNSTVTDLSSDISPGLYILNKDASDILVDPPVVTKLRAYSDNTQPWQVNAGPPDVLEYQILRDPITELPKPANLQEMQIGNLTLGDSANGYLEIASGNTRVPNEYFQGVEVLAGTEKLIDLTTVGLSDPSQVYAVDANRYRFTHKIDCLIEGEFYSICLTKNIGSDNGSGNGSTP